MLKKYLLLFSLLTLSFSIFGQLHDYPVQVTTQVTSPTPFLHEYYTGMPPKLRVTLLNRDIHQPFLRVQLRMKLHSSSLKLTTNSEEHGIGPIIELQAGLPTVLTALDLAPYFQALRLDKDNYRNNFNNVMLPDGQYQFIFEVFEVNTRRRLSTNKPLTPLVWIARGAPPILNRPERGTVITESDIPSIQFNWAPRHQKMMSLGYTAEYEFILRETNDKRLAPEAAFSRELYRQTTPMLTFTHTQANAMLIPGMRYLWQVRLIVRHEQGNHRPNLFENDGYSEMVYFDYRAVSTMFIFITHLSILLTLSLLYSILIIFSITI
jgi:hypothetical protein